MANIRTFDTPALALRPSETGIEAVAGAARREGMFYNQQAGALSQLGDEKAAADRSIGRGLGTGIEAAGNQYVAYEDHKEISHGAAVASDMFSNLENQWNDAIKNANPNDPSVAAKFKETVLQPALDQFSEGFSTENSQKFAQGIVDRYQQHFATKMSADLSTMAGIAAKENATKTINSLSSAVYTDPSSLDTAIDTLKHSAGSIVDSSPTIDAETGARVKSELNQKGVESLVKSAVSGMIEKNPNVDLDAIQKKYGEYINGAELKQFQKAAQVQAKSNALVDKQTAVAQRQLDELNVHKASTQVLTDNVTFDPQTGRPIVDPKYFSQALDIARKNPNAPNAAATVQTMFNWGESQQSKSDHLTDPSVASALDSRMWVPENPTTKLDVMKAEADKKISRPDAQIRMNLIDQRDKMPTDPQYKFAMDGAKELIDGRTPGERSMQAGKYAAFMQDFLSQYQRQKAAGTLPPDALSLRNPNSLISKAMESYKSPLAAAIGGNGGVSATPSTPAEPKSAEPPKVATKEQFDALPAGSVYISTDGKPHRKP